MLSMHAINLVMTAFKEVAVTVAVATMLSVPTESLKLAVCVSPEAAAAVVILEVALMEVMAAMTKNSVISRLDIMLTVLLSARLLTADWPTADPSRPRAAEQTTFSMGLQ